MRVRKLNNPCDGCPKECHRIDTVGDRNARFLVVTKAPASERQIDSNRHLVGRDSKIFAQLAQEAGFTKSDFVFHAGVRCTYDPDVTSKEDRKLIEDQCREHLLRVIDKLKPEVIIPLGAQATKQVYGKAKKITKVRGVAVHEPEFDCVVLPMLDPFMASIHSQYEKIMEVDLQSLARLVDREYDIEGIESDAAGEYEIVYDLQFMIDRAPEVVAFDIEGSGLRWQEPGKIYTFQLTDTEGKAWIVPWDHPESQIGLRGKARIRRQLEQLLCRPECRVIGQHLKFDAQWLREKEGIVIRISDDTEMMIATLDENLPNKDLSTLTKIYVEDMAGYDDAFNSKYDKSRMDLVPLNELKNYGGGDADASLRLFNIFEPMLQEDPKLYRNYRYVSMPGINGFRVVETEGMPINEDALDVLEETVIEGQEKAYKALIKQVPREIKREHLEAGKELSFGRADFVIDILFKHPKGFKFKPIVFTKKTAKLPDHLKRPSISSKDHLPYFFDRSPFVMELATYMKNQRMLTSSIQKFRENYMYNGRIYPIYNLTKAVTGRSNSRDPNGQNFPKRGTYAKAYRSIFQPPPGYVLLEADLSQAELRIAGDMARDPVITRIYAEGGDIHTNTAMMVLGVNEREFRRLDPEEQSLSRFKAKAVNFGFIYGMWWRKFIGYAKTQYDVSFSEREAQDIRRGYFDLYPGLEPWHQSVREFAMEHGYVRSYSGRIRHLPDVYSIEEYVQQEALRQAINSPVQEFGSTLGVMAMSRVTQHVDQNLLRVIGFVHDALYAYVKAKHIVWGAQMLKWYMESNPLKEWFNCDMTDRIPIVADVSFGPHGGKQYEMKGLQYTGEFDFSTIRDLEMDIPEQVEPENDGIVQIPDYLDIYDLADRLCA